MLAQLLSRKIRLDIVFQIVQCPSGHLGVEFASCSGVVHAIVEFRIRKVRWTLTEGCRIDSWWRLCTRESKLLLFLEQDTLSRMHIPREASGITGTHVVLEQEVLS